MYSGHDVNVIFNLIKILSLTVKLPIEVCDSLVGAKIRIIIFIATWRIFNDSDCSDQSPSL